MWTGEEMIVWAGIARGSDIVPVADGAAYDPATMSWRTLARAPPGLLGDVASAAAWTGHVAVFWTGNSPDGPAAGATYDPATDRWRRLATGPLGPREGYASVWTGTELLIIGGTSGDGFARPVAAAVDPRGRSWRLLPALNELAAFRPTGGVWSGHEAFVLGLRYLCPEQGSGCARSRALFLAYDPATDVIRQIDLTGAPVRKARRSSLVPVGWTGTEVVLATAADPSKGLLFYEPSTGAWRTGSAPPCAPADPFYAQTIWLGDRWVVPCGDDGLQIYDAATQTWESSTAGSSPLNTRQGSAIVWTGTTVVAWSGVLERSGNPTPNTGGSIVLGSGRSELG